jgi:hypothetical protein
MTAWVCLRQGWPGCPAGRWVACRQGTCSLQGLCWGAGTCSACPGRPSGRGGNTPVLGSQEAGAMNIRVCQRADGPCTCLQRYDCHPLLIWNLGKGRFMDYTVLHSYLHRWRACGMSMHALRLRQLACYAQLLSRKYSCMPRWVLAPVFVTPAFLRTQEQVEIKTFLPLK